MQLSIDSLKSMGAFTGAPVEREITWSQSWAEYDENDVEVPGTREQKEFTATVFVRRLSYRSAVSDILAGAGRVDGVAGRIAACICGADGKVIFTPVDIMDGPIVLNEDGEPELDEKGEPLRMGPLDGNLTMALLAVIGEVNQLGKMPSSPTSTNSGTS